MPGSPHARGPSVTRNPSVYSEVTVPQVTPTTSHPGPETLREQRNPGAQLLTVSPSSPVLSLPVLEARSKNQGFHLQMGSWGSEASGCQGCPSPASHGESVGGHRAILPISKQTRENPHIRQLPPDHVAGAGKLREKGGAWGRKSREQAAGRAAWPAPTLLCGACAEAAARPCSSSSCSSSSCSSVGSKLYIGMSWWRSFSSLGWGQRLLGGRAGPSPPTGPSGTWGLTR